MARTRMPLPAFMVHLPQGSGTPPWHPPALPSPLPAVVSRRLGFGTACQNFKAPDLADAQVGSQPAAQRVPSGPGGSSGTGRRCMCGADSRDPGKCARDTWWQGPEAMRTRHRARPEPGQPRMPAPNLARRAGGGWRRRQGAAPRPRTRGGLCSAARRASAGGADGAGWAVFVLFFNLCDWLNRSLIIYIQ